jgi:hypothetical protein
MPIQGRRLRCEQAPEPERIIWENMKFSDLSRILRCLVSFVIMLGLVAFCVVIVAVSIGFDDAALDLGGTEACPAGFSSLPKHEQEAAAIADDQLVHCYCDPLGTEAAKEDVCVDYYEAWAGAIVFRVFTAVVCIASSSLVDVFFSLVWPFEKHLSFDGMEKSVMVRSFLIKILLQGEMTSPLSSFPVFTLQIPCRNACRRYIRSHSGAAGRLLREIYSERRVSRQLVLQRRVHYSVCTAGKHPLSTHIPIAYVLPIPVKTGGYRE